MAGHGQPCAKAIILCGDLYGWAGSVLGLRSAIKTYHEDHRKSPARKRFEDFASNFDSQHGTERVAEPESSRDMQLGTRLVKLEVPRMRGYDWALGDPGPMTPTSTSTRGSVGRTSIRRSSTITIGSASQAVRLIYLDPPRCRRAGGRARRCRRSQCR